MAINFKEAESILNSEKLNLEETTLLKDAENYIDDEINRLFDNNLVHIAAEVFEFDCQPKHINLKNTRKKILTNHLKQIYINAGWNVTFMPNKNLCTSSYILSGKT